MSAFEVTPEIVRDHQLGRIDQVGLYDLVYNVTVTCKCGESKDVRLNARWARMDKGLMDEEIDKKMHEHRMDVAAKKALAI